MRERLGMGLVCPLNETQYSQNRKKYKTRLFRLYIIYSTYTANDSRYGFYSKGFSVCPFKNKIVSYVLHAKYHAK